jgi:hypothetical protein
MTFSRPTLSEIIARMDADASRLVLSGRPVNPVSFVGVSIRTFAVIAIAGFFLVLFLLGYLPNAIRRMVRRLSIKAFHLVDCALFAALGFFCFSLLTIYGIVQRTYRWVLLPEWMRGDPERPEALPTGATTAEPDGVAAGGIKSGVGSSNAGGDGIIFHQPTL